MRISLGIKFNQRGVQNRFENANVSSNLPDLDQLDRYELSSNLKSDSESEMRKATFRR